MTSWSCDELTGSLARSSFDSNRLCTSGFVDDVLFSHNGANGPQSETTRMFCPVRHVAAPGATFAVYDCILF